MSSLSQLTPLLPSTPYLLAYALPMLFLSLLVTFAGTFLTLDRSRSFPSRGTATAYSSLAMPGALAQPKTKRRKLSWVLEGGVGGLSGGFVFGVHLSTALALLIPAKTSSASLSSKSLLAVWILSSILTTPLAGRYRYAAYVFYGVAGGTLSSLALCVIIHPSLTSRVILTAVFLPLFTILVLLFASIPRLSTACFHSFLRVCTASTGAFGIVVSIALLLNPQQTGWANVWERLWLADGEGWGTTREQGLSAAFFVFFVAGIATDWALKRWIGECPDEKWDSYLAHYAANLPNQADRAGTFQPLASFWDKLFPSSALSTPSMPFERPNHKKRGSKQLLFPDETDLKSPLPLPLTTMHNVVPTKLTKKDNNLPPQLLHTRAETLRKPRQKGFAAWRNKVGDDQRAGGRKPVKFGGDVSSDSSESDSDGDDTKKGSTSASSPPSTPTMRHKRPFALGQQGPSESYSSSATLVEGRVERARQERKDHRQIPDTRLEAIATLDYEKEIANVKDKLRRKGGGRSTKVDEQVEYSDYEEDLTAMKSAEGGKGWSPAFLQRHQSQSPDVASKPVVPITPGAVPVPATPSLIKAIDRLAVAQRDAYGFPASPTPQSKSTKAADVDSLVDMEAGQHGEKQKEERAPRWEEFWREVRVKAQG